MSIRNDRISEILRDLGARFLQENSSGASLMTVTSVGLSSDGKHATIFFTVFSAAQDEDSKKQLEKTALEFAKRKRSEFKQFVKDNSRLGRIPLLDFEIDEGEKNRQKIDDLLNE
jgi:ribosome-binding factor A